MTSIYDGQFGGNILAVARTGCGKTTFLEKLGINKFFSNLVKTKLKTHDIPDENDVNSLFGENKKTDRLIVMDDVSGVVNISKKFANFLTVSRKFGYHCVYVFHVIASAKQMWQKIISQTNIFNIFPASVAQNTVVKILQSNCILQSKKYLPVRSLWVNRVFTDLANSHKKHCLTIDCVYKNKNGYRLI